MDQQSLFNDVLTMELVLSAGINATGIVFAYAAISKLLDVESLVAGLRAYRIIPDRIAPLAAGLLIIGESLVAISHLVAIGLQFVMPGTIILLLVFAVLIARVLKRGERTPCLCFGASSNRVIDIHSLLRVSALIIVELAVYFYALNDDGLIPVITTARSGRVGSLGLAAISVTLVAWCFALPKFARVWRTIST